MGDSKQDRRDQKKRKGKMVVHGARFREMIRIINDKLRKPK